MQFHDLRELDNNDVIKADVCIIGSGPAGLSIAGEYANTGKSVWVIESGGRGIDAPTQKLYQYENVGAQRCLNQDLIRIRAYGGTSALWSGRVAPFREIDFAKRDWVDYSGWPITREDLNPYLKRAGEILGLGPNQYDDSLWSQFKMEKPRPCFNEENLRSEFWQFSRSKQIKKQPTRFAEDFNPQPSANLNILLYANVTHINTDDEGRQIESVSVTTLEGVQAMIKSTLVVVCCGGVENARLLLASNKQHSRGLGNHNDMVGRFFMDHPYCELGEFSVAHSRELVDRFSHFWLDDDSGRHVYLHGLTLGKEIQEKEQLLNCAVYLVQDADIDSSWLTAKRLVMALKARKFNMDVAKDAGRLLLGLDKILDGFFRRYFKNRPPILKSNRIALGCNVEQLPDHNSRITLSDKLDAIGMPLARIDWKISERERDTVNRMIEIINLELPAIGLPAMKPVKWLDNEKWRDNFFDVAHHMGSTRMSSDPRQGVVDENCKVYDVKGLYIAGGSVFPTAGTANPTLMIVSMALRLADHLKSLPRVQAMPCAKSASTENLV
ncbi:MAG: GMC family oxidoreductase [Curvibacter sp.]|nr:MAG: GMC family oxidoreductase [Curvibacter sp.]